MLEWNTIDIMPGGTKIGFGLHIPMEEELRDLPNIEATYGSECNLNTVRLGKVSTYNNSNAFHSRQHTFGYHTMETG